MARFDISVGEVLHDEGGKTDTPKTDRGGRTNFGITHTLGKQYGYDDVYKLTRNQAIAIYRKHFWDGELRGHLNSVRVQAIADAIFSFAVNAGTTPAVKVLQETLREMGDEDLAIDGRMGPATVAAINASRDDEEMLRTFQRKWALWYCKLTREKVRLGRDWLTGRITKRELESPAGKAALLNVNQIENLVGWVTRALS